RTSPRQSQEQPPACRRTKRVRCAPVLQGHSLCPWVAGIYQWLSHQADARLALIVSALRIQGEDIRRDRGFCLSNPQERRRCRGILISNYGEILTAGDSLNFGKIDLIPRRDQDR